MKFLKYLSVTAFLLMGFNSSARTITTYGQGIGGTTQGDVRASCGRAQRRAVYDAVQSCERQQRGYVLSTSQSRCSCRVVSKRGIPYGDNINCRANARAACQVRRYRGGRGGHDDRHDRDNRRGGHRDGRHGGERDNDGYRGRRG